MKKITRGFTLIELLVVIAIIGVLAAIVLASLSAARTKGNDAKVQEQLNSVRNAGEAYYTSYGNYGAAASPAETDCATTGMGLDTTTGFAGLMSASNWPDNVAPTCLNNSDTTNDSTEFAAWHALADGTYWCVDSSGKALNVGSTAPSGTTCS